MAFSLSGNTITQTGTDTDLSGLWLISGVNRFSTNGQVLYDMGTDLVLVVTGTLYHDPDKEILIFRKVTEGTLMMVTGSYIYGTETTVNGRSRLSSGEGLQFWGSTGTGSFHQWGNNPPTFVSLRVEGGSFTTRGGVISSARVITFTNNVDFDVKGTIFRKQGTTDRREFRLDTAGDPWTGSANFVLDGFQVSHRAFPPVFGVEVRNGEIVQLSDGAVETVIEDFDTSLNISTTSDLGTDSRMAGRLTSPKFFIINNASEGSYIRTMPKDGVGDDRQTGGSIIKKFVSFNLTDGSTSLPIENVKLYSRDTNNGYRKNANGQDHLADKVYQSTSDTNGSIATFPIITAITNINSQGSFSYADWDTTKYNNRYKVDRRGLDESANDNFLFSFASFEHGLSQTTVSCKGLGTLQVDWILFPDFSITQKNKAVVDAYTTINNAQQFYDCAKSYLFDNYSGEAEPIVSRNGNTVNAGSYNVVLDPAANNTFAFNGSTITIKSSAFTGTINTTGMVTDAGSPRSISYGVTGGQLVINDASAPWAVSGNVVIDNLINNDATNNLAVSVLNGANVSTSEAGAGVGLVNLLQAVGISIKVLDAVTNAPISDARVYLESNGSSIFNGLTDVNGSVSILFNYSDDQEITGRVRKSSTSPYYRTGQISGTITSSGFAANILMLLDE